MKIKKIFIYGFGKHENKLIDFSEGMNIIYGHNEAGKTTIQQFILQILFGFPQKNSALLRYEPKSGGKYGGQVHIQDETFGECVIERVRGKSSGEVAVYFEDGTQGGEEALKDIVRQYDRTSFESVFSFSVLQLQGFERMDETELSRTLLASGTTGVDSLVRLEKKMEKEAGELFKKSGRVPEMNVRLQELKEIEEKLKEEQNRILAYEPKVKRISEIDREWSTTKEKFDAMRDRYRTLEIQLQLLPLSERKRTLVSKLSTLRQEEFPADGIRRYEMVNSRLTEMQARLHGLEDEIKTMRERIQDGADSENLPALKRLLAREPEWHEWRSGLSTIRENQKQLKSKNLQLLDRLGMDRADGILQADVSIHREEQLYIELQNAAEMDRQLGYIDRQLSQVEIELKDLSVEQRLLEENGPSSDDLRQVEEWPSTKAKLAEARAYLQLDQTDISNGNRVLNFLLLLVALVAIVSGVIEKQWLFLVIGLCIAGAVVFQFIGERKKTPLSKQNDMKQFVEKFAGKENQMEQLVEMVLDFQQKQSQLTEAIKSTERSVRRLEEEYETISREKEVAEEMLRGFFRTYGLMKVPNPGILHEFFGMARTLQEIDRDYIEIEQHRQSLVKSINSRIEEIGAFVQDDLAEEMLYEKLRTMYITLQSEEQARASASEQVEKIKAEKKEIEEHLSSLIGQREALFHEAGVTTEEQYYEAHQQYNQFLMLTDQLDDVNSQLALHKSTEELVDVLEDDLKKEIVKVEQEIAELERELAILVETRASLRAETEKMLTDDAYQHKQQYFEMKKAELAELATQWASRQVIVEAVKGMMQELKDRKLPEVLQRAEQLFRQLTDDRYVSLEITEDGLFRGVAKNGTRYPIIELSQATKEQAYISLRLSLAMAMESVAPFPILMDDPFVHFDEKRLSRMMNIVGQISGKHQFIYTTCHDKIIEEWTNATIINVSEIGNDKGAMAR